MVDARTISDSKRAFHLAFPYVIPPIYRRIADELLVELNLLSHQKKFEVDQLFATGLCEVFNTFTKGYEPETHIKELFNALCISNGFDPDQIRNYYNQEIRNTDKYKKQEIEKCITSYEVSENENTKIISTLNPPKHYSRLYAVGVLALISKSNSEKSDDPETITKLTMRLLKGLGLPEQRVEKDISLYNSNIVKLKQALDLMRETIESDKKKKSIREKEKARSAS